METGALRWASGRKRLKEWKTASLKWRTGLFLFRGSRRRLCPFVSFSLPARTPTHVCVYHTQCVLFTLRPLRQQTAYTADEQETRQTTDGWTDGRADRRPCAVRDKFD